MWYLKTMLVVVAAVGALLFGSTIAHGFWWWNARVDVEGEHIRTMWGVEAPGVNSYSAVITVSLPEGASAQVLKEAPNEDVLIENSADLRCLEDGIEAKVTYKITAGNGDPSGSVAVSVETGKGKGTVLAEGNGTVGDVIQVEVIVPGSCSG